MSFKTLLLNDERVLIFVLTNPLLMLNVIFSRSQNEYPFFIEYFITL